MLNDDKAAISSHCSVGRTMIIHFFVFQLCRRCTQLVAPHKIERVVKCYLMSSQSAGNLRTQDCGLNHNIAEMFTPGWHHRDREAIYELQGGGLRVSALPLLPNSFILFVTTPLNVIYFTVEKRCQFIIMKGKKTQIQL